MIITVLGAGVAGLCTATALMERGLPVQVVDPGGGRPASWYAGGMLAPFCEGESAPQEIVVAGQSAAAWWAQRFDGVEARGTLVVAPARDQAELDRFARATGGHVYTDPADLEPDLRGRFTRGLYFGQEAHMDPRAALAALSDRLRAQGIDILRHAAPAGPVVDCRGLAARDRLPDLRAVRGEMLLVEAPDVHFTRTLRLLHPRFPCYVVPRGAGHYMIGATMVESEDQSPISARALMELLSAAYTLHPGFAEARVVETGTGLRPSFPDNIPAIRRLGDRICLNGMYRHGFLMAPVLAEQLADQMAKEFANAH